MRRQITAPGILAAILAAALAACSSAPTMPSAEEIAADKQVAFGSAEVIIDKKRQKWGFGWTGESHFYLLILPDGSSKAISYDLTTDGNFYWPLAAGRYLLLGYHWQKGNEQRRGDIGAEFVVPDTGEDVYIGSLTFIGNEFVLGSKLVDDYEESKATFETKFPGRRNNSISGLMTQVESPGTVGSVSGPCHESWQIECTDRFSGVTPLAPEVHTSGFTDVGSLTPEFSWKGSSRSDVTYDLVIYEAATYTTSGVMDSYSRGRLAQYVEGLPATTWRPKEPLNPDTKYYWSVRMRDGDKVSSWTTHSHFTFMLIASSSGYGQWFQFETP